jgi:hypothetical protein
MAGIYVRNPQITVKLTLLFFCVNRRMSFVDGVSPFNNTRGLYESYVEEAFLCIRVRGFDRGFGAGAAGCLC